MQSGVEKMLAWLSDFLAPPPPMTRDQAERAERVAEETREARADEAARQEKDAA